MVAAAVGIGTAVAGAYSADKASDNARDASRTQANAELAGIDERRRQFDIVQKLFAPYIKAGSAGLRGAQGLIGLRGNEAQQQEINRLQASPQFTSLVNQGENAILANASATGGLRGGNTQASLAQFRPQLLSQLIDQQFARYGGLAQMGQASAAGVGSGALATGMANAQSLSNRGAYLAGGQLAQPNYVNAIGQGFGAYLGAGGTFGSGGTNTQAGQGSSGYFIPGSSDAVNQINWTGSGL